MKKQGKKVLVCIDLTIESINLVKNKIKDWDWIGTSEVIFCHVFQPKFYSDYFLFGSYFSGSQHQQMKNIIEGVLEDISEEVFFKNTSSTPHYFSTCIFALNKKKAVANYISTHNIDEVVVGTSKSNGIVDLFSSSFGNYVIDYADCDFRILKHGFSITP